MSGGDQLFQDFLFPDVVHALPEAPVLVAHQLALGGQRPHGLLLEHAVVAVQVVEYRRLQHHVARVDRGAVCGLLLPEGADGIVLADVQYALLLGLVHRGEGGDPAVGAVEIQQFTDVHVAHAVAVGEHEGLVPDVFLHPLDAPAGHGMEAGVDHGDAPGLTALRQHSELLFAAGKIELHIALAEKVVCEPLLDDVLFIPGADDEIVEAVMAVFLHDMP